MDHIEMVEKLRQMAKVTYEEAKDALENSEWDLLDALIYLENQGKVPKQETDSFTTRKEPQKEKAPELDLRSGISKAFSFIVELIDKGNKMFLDVHRNNKLVMSIPLTVLALLLIFMFWWVVPIMVISLFFGVRYSFRGPKSTQNVVNKAMDKAANAAEGLKSHYQDKQEDNQEPQ
jgi:hypothetical protein